MLPGEPGPQLGQGSWPRAQVPAGLGSPYNMVLGFDGKYAETCIKNAFLERKNIVVTTLALIKCLNQIK